ncbi:hypothetical protein K435DRAFT_834479 [Dendrothele bispora CBS 962.96]|uniref:TMEM205-like domain-containing protein n=1 Tax=Dendrothele bispora (strain CBS 962.96) TaxID=1314807 RepID=A0A4S8MSN4_DENBC|nr:hypothetical protein K435DRAFT_834479 [Dendrothele bispora CBS 962.96]
MTKPEVLTFASLVDLLTPKSLYVVTYGWLVGMSIWVTFFGGVIAYKALPRHQFGQLQHKTFPIYFVISILLSAGLTGMWTLSHPDVQNYIQNPFVADVAQAYTLASVSIAQGLNYFVVGPMTSKTMFQRQRLEKSEGKTYNEAGVSEEMKALNRRFGSLHGISSLANLWAVIALIFHGLWIGNTGI